MSNVRLSVWRESVWPPASYQAKATKESILERRKRKKENVSVSVLSEVLWFDELSCPQIWNMEKEKDEEKQKAGRQASEAQPGKELERERKSKGNIFCWRNHMKFCSGGEKMRNAFFHQSKHERREKQKKKTVNKNTYNLFSGHITGNQEISGSFTL